MKPVTLKEIERFLTITGWGPSRFGRAAIDDARIVFDLRAGRSMTRGVDERIAKFMVEHTAAEAEKVAKLRRLVK
jgi:hypothetical protein